MVFPEKILLKYRFSLIENLLWLLIERDVSESPRNGFGILVAMDLS